MGQIEEVGSGLLKRWANTKEVLINYLNLVLH